MDFTDILSLGSSPFQVFSLILRNGGLIIFFPILVWMAYFYWMNYIWGQYASKINWVLLAVDVPKENEQSMAAIERIMEALHGVHFTPNKKEKYWLGVLSEKFSLEIVSIDGYIQYFIRAADYNVDLVKGAFFAQYPDAEIVEVEDYVDNVPQNFPNDKNVDMWGTEFVLAKPDVYPIKTYEFFEHSLSGMYADPMAALLELLSRLRPGEQVWLQLLIVPESHTWRERGIKEIGNLIEKKMPTKKDMVDRMVDITRGTLETVHDTLWTVESSGAQAGADENPDGKWLSMTTGDKIVVEEIQKKISRMGFTTKFRFIYIANKDVMNVYRVIGGVLGALKQFSTLDLNAFTAGGHLVTTGPTYLFYQRRRDWRKRKLMLGYKYRSDWSGEPGYVLSTTELATLYHFPTIAVRAPLVSKAEAKKAEPPSRLPVEAPVNLMEIQGDTVVVEADTVEIAEELPVAPQGEGQVASIPAPPAPPGNRQQIIPPPPVPSRHTGTEYPLHSMPGLPPGVHVKKEATVPGQSPYQKARNTMQPISQPITAQQPVQQQPVQSVTQQPVQQPLRKSPTPQPDHKGGEPPMNLPI